MDALRVGTRGSALAMTQTGHVVEWMRERMTRRVDVVQIRTQGDAQQDVPLSQIGGKGVFVKELEAALLSGDIDVAVHSAKDLPSDLAPGTELAAFPQREDPRDALIVRPGLAAKRVEDLPQGARIGTGSLRRRVQLKRIRPDVRLEDLRGNVDTRLRKVNEGLYDAIVLAAAGLARLGYSSSVTQLLEVEQFIPAVSQGILAVQTRSEPLAHSVRSALDAPPVRLVAETERGFLSAFGAGCQIPIAAHATWDAGTLRFRALVAGLEGVPYLSAEASHAVRIEDVDRARRIGADLARDLLDRGGRALLEQLTGR